MQLHEETIFNEALDIADEQARQAFLDKACGDNEQLRRKVDRLLQIYPQGEALEPDCPGMPGAQGEPTTARERIGDKIGPYQLLEQLGEGGMGIVYMAEQTKPVRRKVALKIIKVGMDTGQVIARFEAERQALALMNHPNIAQVLDAGETETGRPYFVMELVRGIPITEFCDQQELTSQQRLELFINVCEAVQHAHQKGIIHRDIKPSNVLVELHDIKAIPKIIDFGIAKATNQRLTERTLFTQFSQMIGTPMYMSPEQAQLSGLDIDTRTDIYSLGVLLYELLTGTAPFDRETFKSAAFDEIRRIIREDQPPRPSHRISTLKAKQQLTVVETPNMDVMRRRRHVDRELDWIVMKALEKDRTRRYQSAIDFAKDIQRYIDGDTIDAHPPSLAYRTKKLIRRYRSAIAVTAGAMLIMLASTVVSVRYAIVARAASKRADARSTEAANQRQVADKNFRLALEAVNQYLTEVSENQLLDKPELKPLRENLLKMALGYHQQFVADRGSDRELQRELANGYFRVAKIVRDIGSHEDALEAHLSALSIRSSLVAANPTNSEYRYDLAVSYQWIARMHGKSKEAIPHYENAISILKVLVDEHPTVANYRATLASVYHDSRKPDPDSTAAQSALVDAIALLEPLTEENPQDAENLRLLAHCYLAEGLQEKALSAVERALAIKPDDLSIRRLTLIIQRRIANKNDDLHARLVSLQRIAAEFEQLVEDNAYSLGFRSELIHEYLAGVADTQERLGQTEDRIETIKHTITQIEELEDLSPQEFQIVNTLMNHQRDLGLAYERAGSLREARQAFESCLSGVEDCARASGDPLLQHQLEMHLRIARLSHDTQAFDEADQHFIAAREFFEEVSSSGRPMEAIMNCLDSCRLYPAIDDNAQTEKAKLLQAVARRLGEGLDLVREECRNRVDSMIWTWWSRIALAYYSSRNWEGADQEADLAVELSGDNPRLLIRIAPFYLLAGKPDAFHQVCDRLIASSETSTGWDLFRAVIICSLDPIPREDPQPLLQMAQRAVENGPKGESAKKDISGAQQLIRARLGEYEKSLPTFNEYELGELTPIRAIRLSIVYHLADRAEEARSFYEAAMRDYEDFNSTNGALALRTEVLYMEAKRLIHTVNPSEIVGSKP